MIVIITKWNQGHTTTELRTIFVTLFHLFYSRGEKRRTVPVYLFQKPQFLDDASKLHELCKWNIYCSLLVIGQCYTGTGNPNPKLSNHKFCISSESKKKECVSSVRVDLIEWNCCFCCCCLFVCFFFHQKSIPAVSLIVVHNVWNIICAMCIMPAFCNGCNFKEFRIIFRHFAFVQIMFDRLPLLTAFVLFLFFFQCFHIVFFRRTLDSHFVGYTDIDTHTIAADKQKYKYINLFFNETE